jgi:hypothetical protein
MYRIAQQVLRGEHAWLETGIVSLIDDDLGSVTLAQTQARVVRPKAKV